MRILIVEDDQLTAELVREYLEPFSSKIYYASSLERACQFCEHPEIDFDVIMLDLRLEDSNPDNTVDSISALKSMQPDAAVLVMSGMSPVDRWREMSLNGGADGFLYKDISFSRQAIYMAVFAALGNRSSGNHSDTFLQNLKLLERLATS